MLKKTGVAQHVSGVTGRLIVRGIMDGEIGRVCTDASGFVIGKVDEVFGPVKKPYIAISSNRKVDFDKYVGSTVFTANIEDRRRHRKIYNGKSDKRRIRFK